LAEDRHRQRWPIHTARIAEGPRGGSREAGRVAEGGPQEPERRLATTTPELSPRGRREGAKVRRRHSGPPEAARQGDHEKPEGEGRR